MGICVCMYRLLAMCIYNVIFACKQMARVPHQRTLGSFFNRIDGERHRGPQSPRATEDI